MLLVGSAPGSIRHRKEEEEAHFRRMQSEQTDSKQQQQKTAIVTGATGQIGKEIALGLANKGLRIILAARNVKKAEKVATEIQKITKNSRVEVEQVDLSSPSSIRSFVHRFAKRDNTRLDVLVNNAAIVPHSKTVTKEGLELQFATNVLSYFMLAVLLRPILRQTAEASLKLGSGPSRIVNVASQYAGGLDLTDLHFQRRKYNANTAYKQSKQANRVFSHTAASK
mmetsp:Transcript_8040/g.12945  ORF Transcript_8040/g.12945 Transcript_8040/m.12945 type:complete len:225 (-) Transcript_8040:701-1375(-)